MSGPVAFQGKSYAIYGLGRVGLVTARVLAAAGAEVFAWDEREAQRDLLQDEGVRLMRPVDWPFARLSAVVPGHLLSPKLTPDNPVFALAAEHGVPVESDAMLMTRHVASLPSERRPLMIGVTGSHGKSLTARMLVHMFNDAGMVAAQSDQRRLPVLRLLTRPLPKVIIQELPARVLTYVRKGHFDAAILTCIREMDRRFFPAAEDCLSAYMRIFRGQKPGDAMIIGVDDAAGQKICTALSACLEERSVGSDNLVPVSGEAALGQGVFALQSRIFDARFGRTDGLGDGLDDRMITGRHSNLALAAVTAAGLQAGLGGTRIIATLKSWPGLPGRMYMAACMNGIRFVDDSRARSRAAVMASLSGARDVFWICGGDIPHRNFSRITEAASGVSKAYLFGAAAEAIERQFAGKFPTTCFDSAEKAVLAAIHDARHARGEDETRQPMVLFSPGLVSRQQAGFSDMFAALVTAYDKKDAA